VRTASPLASDASTPAPAKITPLVPSRKKRSPARRQPSRVRPLRVMTRRSRQYLARLSCSASAGSQRTRFHAMGMSSPGAGASRPSLASTTMDSSTPYVPW
jgi:hypothetical protein